MRTALFFLVSLLGLQAGTTLRKAPKFDPFPVGRSWTMRSIALATNTTWTVAAITPNLSYACHTPGDASLMVDLKVTKTNALTYWNPGQPQNLDYFIYKDPTYGPVAFFYQASQMTAPFTVLSTSYYFNAQKSYPTAALLVDSATNSATVTDSGSTNRCPPFPGSFPNTWTTVVTNEVRTTPVYTGNVLCGTYDLVTASSESKEEWCFANDPTNVFPPVLVELDDLIVNGQPSTLVLQTTQVISF